MVFCSACGHQISAQALHCTSCGHPNQANAAAAGTGALKSRVAAGLFGILLGSFGVHKFYLGKAGMGVLYLLFFWSGVPGIVGLIEGIVYLTQSDAQFAQAQGVRVG